MEELHLLEEQGLHLIFISHQWTSFTEPDHTTAQMAAMKAGVRRVAKLRDWSLSEVLLWADYSSLPQTNLAEQREGIIALPAYTSSAQALLIAAPPVKHKETGARCDLLSYRKRMWCRVEQLCFIMANSIESIYVATGVEDDEIVLATEDAHMQDQHELTEGLKVFQGTATDDSDKLKLVIPLLGMYAQMLRRVKLQTSPALVTSQLQKTFALFDTDGSGGIEKFELKAAITKCGRSVTDEEISEIMERVDTDHDEKITLIEFEEIFKLVPDALPAELVRLFGQDSGFMPREVTVFHVFKKGKRVKVPNPKRQTLFGTLPERAARKVDEVLELELKTSNSSVDVVVVAIAEKWGRPQLRRLSLSKRPAITTAATSPATPANGC